MTVCGNIPSILTIFLSNIFRLYKAPRRNSGPKVHERDAPPPGHELGVRMTALPITPGVNTDVTTKIRRIPEDAS